MSKYEKDPFEPDTFSAIVFSIVFGAALLLYFYLVLRSQRYA